MRFGAVAGISEMKAFIDSTRVFNTVSCRKVNLPCVKDILHAPRTWDVVQTTLPHKCQLASVVMCQRFKLDGDGKTSNVEARQKESKFGGMARMELHERSCFTYFSHLVH